MTNLISSAVLDGSCGNALESLLRLDHTRAGVSVTASFAGWDDVSFGGEFYLLSVRALFSPGEQPKAGPQTSKGPEAQMSAGH